MVGEVWGDTRQATCDRRGDMTTFDLRLSHVACRLSNPAMRRHSYRRQSMGLRRLARQAG